MVSNENSRRFGWLKQSKCTKGEKRNYTDLRWLGMTYDDLEKLKKKKQKKQTQEDIGKLKDLKTWRLKEWLNQSKMINQNLGSDF